MVREDEIKLTVPEISLNNHQQSPKENYWKIQKEFFITVVKNKRFLFIFPLSFNGTWLLNARKQGNELFLVKLQLSLKPEIQWKREHNHCLLIN